jgi:parallel beta-helix repeat protein
MRTLTFLRLPLVATGIIALGIPTASARVWYLMPDGLGDVPTIQAAIDSASTGDVILLADGIYRDAGNCGIDFLGKDITICSESGDPEFCIIDCGGCEPPPGCEDTHGVLFRSGEGPASVLEGVQVRYGNGWPSVCVGPCIEGAGGVVVDGASPTLRNLLVTQNGGGGISLVNSSAELEDCMVTGNYDGGMYIAGSSATLTGCVIAANGTMWSHGGGIVLSGSSPTLESCVIAGNVAIGEGSGQSAGGGVYATSSSPTFRRTVITGNSANYGGGLWLSGGSPVFEECTISRNQATRGGGIYGSPAATMTSTILWGNCASAEGADAYLGSTASIQFSCCDVDPAGIAGSGALLWVADNFSEPPLFCAPLACEDAPESGGEYSLRQNSPLLGWPQCGVIGGLGEGCGVAVVGSSWGRIKSLYR